jgi:hypothetical protein
MPRNARPSRRLLLTATALVAIVATVIIVVSIRDDSDAKPTAIDRLRDLDVGTLAVRYADDPYYDRITSAQLAEARASADAVFLDGDPVGPEQHAVLRSTATDDAGRPLWHYAVWVAFVLALAVGVNGVVRFLRAQRADS